MLNNAESNYSQLEKEVLALIFGGETHICLATSTLAQGVCA